MVAAQAKSAFTVPEIKAFWASRSVGRSKGRNDRLEKNRGGVSYYLFRNEIAFYDPNKHTLEITNLGYETSTTKNRLNNLLRSGKIKAYIYQEDFSWYLHTPKGRSKWPGSLKFRV